MGDPHLAPRHVERLGGRVDDVVDRLHGEIEGHELDDGAEPRHGGPDPDAGETVFRDRSVDDALLAELLQKTLRDLVGALVLGHLLAHHEDRGVATHLFGHRVAQGFAHRHGHHLGVGRELRLDPHGGAALKAVIGRISDRFATAAPRRRGFRGDIGRTGLGTCRRCNGRNRAVGGFRNGRRGIGRFAIGPDHADRRVDRDVVGPFLHQDGAERALVDGLHLHGGLVGLDLGQHVAGFDRVPDLLDPFAQLALLHRGRQSGHQYVGGHVSSLVPRRLGRPGVAFSKA